MRFFSDLVPRHILAVSILTLMAACGGGGSGSTPAPPDQGGGGTPPPPVTPDFGEVDAAFQSFIDESIVFDGISYVVVDAAGTLHTGTFGDHTEDTVVMLASTSKVPAVMTLMALEEDPASTFSMSQPIGEVLPFNGVYADRTPAQLVSNTSGIPGLRQLGLYGPHLCQFSFEESIEFEACGQILLSVPLPDSHDAGSIFDYGGSQWQLAGVTAAVSANATWNQLVDQYLATPCELEVFTFGNMWENLFLWDGTPDSLLGQSNPNIEGGAITNLADYAKLLQVHLNGGYCGETQVLSEAALAEMRVDRGGVVAEDAVPYGMGWWIDTDNPGVYDDPGAFGSVSFLDIERGFGGYVAIDDYTRIDADAPARLVRRDIIPLLQSAFDAVAE
jgi:CubicO group peptidase (beta-lactamase class C family)